METAVASSCCASPASFYSESIIENMLTISFWQAPRVLVQHNFRFNLTKPSNVRTVC